MAENISPFAVSGAVDPGKIRVVLFSSNRLVHISLSDLIKPLTDEINDLKTRLSALEG
ncbi:hypothetical protein [Ochrobactrum chromiisoli]|uniref:Uncharacterized protein n=1 Tax=Ochrobactrum chromiisoli TaxID=2993941 RepID=A0ABT3QUL6_9HYPH|nr:hypothetical protein [Ochrobactrum chromiisoli]MCX2699288.1 hypothetical protein [Ochrobactrum chromiisoli]